MFSRVRSRITGKQVIGIFVLTNLVYGVMLSFSIPKLMSYSSGLPIFDMSPMGYSFAEAAELLFALGSDGREFYMTQLTLDTLYPFLFGLCYFVLLQWVIKKGNVSGVQWQWLSLFPIVAALFDYLENICIYLMLSSFPELSTTLVSISSAFTITKSALTTVYWLGLVILIIMITIQKYRHRAA
ncbi:hypothetical protein ACPV4B_01000 [Vibrio parahaemolyticus]|uniref:hypothetical protein n=1 Tax=Vibrio mediterranei TaxID=689 RepID=UPI00406974FD